MYQYILLDLDNTIFDFNSAEATTIKEVLLSEGVPYTPEHLKTYSQINIKLWQALERGELTKEQVLVGRFEEFFNSLGLTVDATSKEALFRQTFNQQHQLLPGAKEILNYLKAKGYILSSATNGVYTTQVQRMKDARIYDEMSYHFISEAIGYNKPHEEFFKYAIQTLKVTNLSEVLMIGDSVTSDINGALNYGIDSCYIGPRRDTDATYHIQSLNELKSFL